MRLKLLQELGLTNLSEDVVTSIMEMSSFDRALEISKLTPTQRHLYSVQQQGEMQERIAELKSDNARLRQQNRASRITGALSAIAITIGSGLISTCSNGTNDFVLGIGWGLSILGVGILMIKSIVDY